MKILVLGAGASSIRLSPPLVMTEEEVDMGVAVMDEVLMSLTDHRS